MSLVTTGGLCSIKAVRIECMMIPDNIQTSLDSVRSPGQKMKVKPKAVKVTDYPTMLRRFELGSLKVFEGLKEELWE